MADKYLDYAGLSRFWDKVKIYISNAIKVTGVKGNKEGSYRTGNVNITPDNIGAFEKKSYDRGTLEAGIRPYVDQARANRLAFLPADQIIVENADISVLIYEVLILLNAVGHKFKDISLSLVENRGLITKFIGI